MVASRAVNRRSNVSPAALERVQKAVSALQYVPHQGARSLATNRTGSIALVTPMSNSQFFNDPNVAEIVGGAGEVLSKSDIQLVCLICELPHDEMRVAHYINGRHVDGAMLLSADLMPSMVSQLAAAGVPTVGSMEPDETMKIDRVTVDNISGIGEAAELFRRLGCHNVAMIAAPKDLRSSHARVATFTAAAGPLCRGNIAYGDYSAQSSYAETVRLLREDPMIDGLFVATDVMAAAAVTALAGLGCRVPEDVPVIGFDDSSAAVQGTPALTTVRVPFREMGAAFASMLLELLAGRQPGRTITFQTTLVRRASA
jgi:DNA-binding LacI/PurR family transcriptional regulator